MKHKSSIQDKTAVPALDKVMAILGELETRGPSLAGELIAALGLPRSSAYTLLDAMKQHKLVAQDSQGRYRLWMRLLALGQAASASLDIRDVARRRLLRLPNLRLHRPPLPPLRRRPNRKLNRKPTPKPDPDLQDRAPKGTAFFVRFFGGAIYPICRMVWYTIGNRKCLLTQKGDFPPPTPGKEEHHGNSQSTARSFRDL